MSKLAQSTGDDYPEAAKKHLADAEILLGAGHNDGAAYLTGYIVECIWKTMILVANQQPKQIHDLSRLGADALAFASLPGAHTAKYMSLTIAGGLALARPGGWQATLRYRPSGHIPLPTAQAWHAEAADLYRSTLGAMILDGVI